MLSWWLVDDLCCSEVLTLLRSPLHADDGARSLSSRHSLCVGTVLLGNYHLTFKGRLRLVNLHLRLVLPLADDLHSINFVAALPHFPDLSEFTSGLLDLQLLLRVFVDSSGYIVEKLGLGLLLC